MVLKHDAQQPLRIACRARSDVGVVEGDATGCLWSERSSYTDAGPARVVGQKPRAITSEDAQWPSFLTSGSS